MFLGDDALGQGRRGCPDPTLAWRGTSRQILGLDHCPNDAPKGQGLGLQSLTDPRSTSLLHSLTVGVQVRGLSLQNLTFSVCKRGERHLSGASNADGKYTGDSFRLFVWPSQLTHQPGAEDPAPSGCGWGAPGPGTCSPELPKLRQAFGPDWMDTQALLDSWDVQSAKGPWLREPLERGAEGVRVSSRAGHPRVRATAAAADPDSCWSPGRALRGSGVCVAEDKARVKSD